MGGTAADYLTYDPIIAVAMMHYRIFTRFTLATIALLALDAIFLDYSFCYATDNVLFTIIHKLTAINSIEMMDVFHLPKRFNKQKMQTLSNIWKRKNNLHRNIEKLNTFITISPEIRVRLFVITTFIEKIFENVTFFNGKDIIKI